MNKMLLAVFKRLGLATWFAENEKMVQRSSVKNFSLNIPRGSMVDISQTENKIFDLYPVKLYAHAYILPM